jgi:pSer/pThr/pTyr-binding forkhead associated (FHA) protein
MSEEQTIISPAPGALDAERTQIAFAPGADVTQAAIVIQCPVCQTANPPGDRWCRDCGFLLSSQAPEGMDLPTGASGPRLVQDGREYELRQGENSIGRVAADVLLPDPTVSRHHATLTLAEDGAWLEDAGSTNGTFLDGTPVAAGSRISVRDGAALKFGSVTVRLVWPEGAAALPPATPAGEEPGSAAASEPVMARLVAADGLEHALRAGVTTLGRRGENMIVVTGDPFVSGRHAEIRCDAGGCVLVDVGSTNGTFLRSGSEEEWERLPAHDPRPMSPGDELRLGQSAFALHAPLAPVEEALEEVEETEPTPNVDEEARVSEGADTGEADPAQ